MRKQKGKIIGMAWLFAGGIALASALSPRAALAKEYTEKEWVKTSQRLAAPPVLKQDVTQSGSIASLLQTFNSHLNKNGILFSADSYVDVRTFSGSISELSRKLQMDFVHLENDPDQQLEKLLMAIGEEFSQAQLLLFSPSPKNFTECENIFDRVFAGENESLPPGPAFQFMNRIRQERKLDFVLNGWLEAAYLIENVSPNEDPVVVDLQNRVQGQHTRQAAFVLSQCLADLYSGYSAELEKVMDSLEPFGNTNPYQWVMEGGDSSPAVITLDLAFSDGESGAEFTKAELLNPNELSSCLSLSSQIAPDGKSARISFALKPDLTFSELFSERNNPQIQVGVKKTFDEGMEFKKGIDIQASWSVSTISHQINAETIFTELPVGLSLEMTPAQSTLNTPDFFAAKSVPQNPSKPSDPTDNPSDTPGDKPSQKPSAQDKWVQLSRLYNPNSGEHFYTSNYTEKQHLITLGWTDEGIGWSSPKTSAHPVYRLYNPNAGDHHYTMNSQEKSSLIVRGWQDEGIGWYSLPQGHGLPVFRQYNPNAAAAGAHHYTANKAENDYLVSIGWRNEGIAWFARQ